MRQPLIDNCIVNTAVVSPETFFCNDPEMSFRRLRMGQVPTPLKSKKFAPDTKPTRWSFHSVRNRREFQGHSFSRSPADARFDFFTWTPRSPTPQGPSQTLTPTLINFTELLVVFRNLRVFNLCCFPSDHKRMNTTSN